MAHLQEFIQETVSCLDVVKQRLCVGASSNVICSGTEYYTIIINNIDFYIEHSPEIQINALYNTNMPKKINIKIKNIQVRYVILF